VLFVRKKFTKNEISLNIFKKSLKIPNCAIRTDTSKNGRQYNSKKDKYTKENLVKTLLRKLIIELYYRSPIKHYEWVVLFAPEEYSVPTPQNVPFAFFMLKVCT
jgi:hypothetical protein